MGAAPWSSRGSHPHSKLLDCVFRGVLVGVCSPSTVHNRNSAAALAALSQSSSRGSEMCTAGRLRHLSGWRRSLGRDVPRRPPSTHWSGLSNTESGSTEIFSFFSGQLYSLGSFAYVDRERAGFEQRRGEQIAGYFFSPPHRPLRGCTGLVCRRASAPQTPQSAGSA